MTILLNEGDSAEYQCDLVDETGAPVTAVDSLTFTLYDQATSTILNNRAAVDVRANLDGSGHFTLTFESADSPIVNDNAPAETHVALFQARWNGGAGGKDWQVFLRVANLTRVP